MTEPPILTAVISNYPRGVNPVPATSLALGRELLRAYYQCVAITFTLVGWSLATLTITVSMFRVGNSISGALVMAAICTTIATCVLWPMTNQPVAALAMVGARSHQFEVRWKAAICILGPLGPGLVLITMLRSRIVAQLEPYGVADDLTNFQEREIFVLLELQHRMRTNKVAQQNPAPVIEAASQG